MQLTRLGPYEILQPIGKGGMGSVYEAIDSVSRERVAVKALSPQLAQAEGFRERFEAEIESLKTLRHEGIVRLYGYGEQDGMLFYSMELVDGTSLEDELKAGRRFTWREVTDIAIQLCLALKHAHDHGIVHRDIKPANILMTLEERVKLADFGIARLFGNSQLTTAGGVLGTADYVAPEQADGRPVTARCDQYSLGGVMYALLAGRPPFRAKTLPEMLQLQRFAEPEPVRRYADQTPEQLERVILQLLAKEPADRFPNTQVLARHLQAMVMALSRPTPDGFTLPVDRGKDNLAKPEVDQLESLAATQIETELDVTPPSFGGSDAPSISISLQNAATQDAEKVRSVQPHKTPPSEADTKQPERPLPPKAARFTTLEEEQARHQQQQRRPWLLMVAQLVALLAALAALGGLTLYLSRPLTADQLYTYITTYAHQEQEASSSIGNVQRSVDEFLQRFPNDPRASDVWQFDQRLTLDRWDRKLQLQARRNGLSDPALLPVEALYLRATNTAQSSPEEGITLLESLVDLYAAPSAVEADSDGSKSPQLTDEGTPKMRQAACVLLAKREIERLRGELAKQAASQLAALRERLEAAAEISDTEPERAEAMYLAIIDLHANDAWAQDVVTEARRRLDQLTVMNPRRDGEKSGSRIEEETRRQGDKETD